MREFEEENRQLKRMDADVSLECRALKDSALTYLYFIYPLPRIGDKGGVVRTSPENGATLWEV